MVYPGYMPQDLDNDGLDDASGASIIWGAYIIIETVENDTCAGIHGIGEHVTPSGFGTWQP
jgi:hypothetical protein